MSPAIHRGSGNWESDVTKLRKMGHSLPTSPVQARAEAANVATSVANRSLTATMNRQRLASYRQGSNMQLAIPKMREPLGSLRDKGIPFNVDNHEELMDIRRWCNSPQAPVWMADYTFKPIGEIEPGDQVIGWETRSDVWRSGRRELTKTTVLAVNRRMAPEVVRVTFSSGRTVECTPDHEWLRYYIPGPDGRILNGPEKSLTKRYDSEYTSFKVGSVARLVIRPTETLVDPEKIKAASWLAGIIDGEGSWTKRTIRICQSPKHNPHIVERIDKTLDLLGMTYSRYVRERGCAAEGTGHHGGSMVVWDICAGKQGDRSGKNRQQLIDLYNWARPSKMDVEHMDNSFLSRNFGEPDEVVSIESLGPGEVVSMQTGTGNYTAWGYASRNCRLFYTTHDLVPLLIDIYARFPCVGLEFSSKDPMIQKFYEEMFLGDDLNYLEFLPNSLGREYWICGEVTSLGHFNESLGVWSSEEILNPDMLRVSRSPFVQRERVMLLMKDMVENLRQGPMGEGSMLSTTEETPSERKQRTEEYQELAREYPDIIAAAAQNDGMDISEALISRMVNRTTPWANYGTPHLLRSFRTLMMEESLNAAQDAVSDRLYSPLILATLGVPDLGDGEPWIPEQSELDDVRDDMQTALSADFRLLVHNFGLKIESVFGREAVPNLDADYQRIDEKLLQAWGIGEALISGGTGGPYASSALNREVVTQLMLGFQNMLRRHIIKRAEVVAEAQGHFDYDLKGGRRIPIMRDVVVDEGTDRERIVQEPKLLLPEVKFASLNLRDEATERAFIAQLKAMGVPVSDKMMAVNIDMQFEEELERQSDETVAKLVATAQAMRKAQKLCDEQDLPYPAELSQHLMSTLQLRQGKDQTDQLDAQTPVVQEQSRLQLEQMEMQELQMEQQMAMGMGGGMMMPPGQPMGGDPTGGQPTQDPSAGQTAQTGGPAAAGPGAPGPGGAPAGYYAMKRTGANVTGPTAMPPASTAPNGPMGPELPPGVPEPTQPPSEGARNRTRPQISDEQRKMMPKANRRKRTRRGEEDVVVEMPRRKSRFETGPSSYGRRFELSEDEVRDHVSRREAIWRGRPARHPQVADLVKDPNFYRSTNSQMYASQIQADWPDMLAGGAQDSRRLLDGMLEQYFQIYGVEPSW